MDNRLYWIWLSLACGQGSRIAIDLLCALGGPDKIFRADRAALAEALGKEDLPVLNRLGNKTMTHAKAILEQCDESGVHILTPDSTAYPKALYQLRDAPTVLYYVGKLPDFDSRCACAVVGTRKMSEYGKKNAYDIGRGLGAGGAVLVSGLALGCDGMSMAGALSAGGITVGVLGCGIDVIYPPEHEHLMKRVLQEGAVITECPPGTPPLGSNFPKRNRIISGLCDAVVVVEGDKKSGSLITAHHALYQGRDLCAVPGNIQDPGAEGPNGLLLNGARAVTSAADILRKYEFLYNDTLNMDAVVGEMARSSSPEDVNDVAARMKVTASDDKKYYGAGLYGGSEIPRSKPARPINKKKTAPPKTISPKKMVEHFTENKMAEREAAVVHKEHIELDMLGETEKKIYAALVPDVPMLADDIHVKGVEMPALLAGLTMLELSGAIECGAGGYFMRRSADISKLDEEE